MIGQKDNLNQWTALKQNNSIPLLSIIIGQPKTGKTTLVKEFCKILEVKPTFITPNVENIRNMINTAINDTDPELKVYVIEDFDELNKFGQNAVLKIFEEPPKNTHFIITASNIEIMLETILSRGKVFQIKPYSKTELKEFVELKYKDLKNKEDLINTLNNPSEIDYWAIRGDYTNFINYINNVYKEIMTSSCIKGFIDIENNIGFDENENSAFYYKYFVDFLTNKILMNYKWQSKEQMLQFLEIRNNYNKQNRFKGVRKNNLLDMFIIDMYKILGAKK